MRNFRKIAFTVLFAISIGAMPKVGAVELPAGVGSFDPGVIDQKNLIEMKQYEEKKRIEQQEAEEAEVDSDIAKMYEGYLEKDDILPEKARLSATTSQMGVSMDMVVAQADDVAMMSYELAEAEMDIYVEKVSITCQPDIISSGLTYSNALSVI